MKVEEEKQRPVATLSRVMAYNADNKQCLNLTSKAKNGQLQWKAPAGHWNIITLYIGKTFQKVKRAAPGGEGYVMNHLDKGAVKRYFANFDKAFKENKTNFPHTFSMTLTKYMVLTGLLISWNNSPVVVAINWKNTSLNL